MNGISIKVTLINSLLRIDHFGTLGVPRIFRAFHAPKMVVHPCTTKEGPINQTFLKVTLINSLLRIAEQATRHVARIFRAFHAQKMVVHPCATKAGLILNPASKK